jgi:ABC-type multidrug transport system fused ATPase/permease subunit
VDVETDAKLRRTIQTEFATLLCIAHRLNTIGTQSYLFSSLDGPDLDFYL